MIHLLGCDDFISISRKCEPVLVDVRTPTGAKDPLNVTIPETGRTSSCSQDVPSGAVSIKVSKIFKLALMTELTNKLDIDSRDSHAHMGENKIFIAGLASG